MKNTLMSEDQFTEMIQSVWKDEGWGDNIDPVPFGAEGSLLLAGMERVRNFYEQAFKTLNNQQ